MTVIGRKKPALSGMSDAEQRPHRGVGVRLGERERAVERGLDLRRGALEVHRRPPPSAIVTATAIGDAARVDAVVVEVVGEPVRTLGEGPDLGAGQRLGVVEQRRGLASGTPPRRSARSARAARVSPVSQATIWAAMSPSTISGTRVLAREQREHAVLGLAPRGTAGAAGSAALPGSTPRRTATSSPGPGRRGRRGGRRSPRSPPAGRSRKTGLTTKMSGRCIPPANGSLTMTTSPGSRRAAELAQDRRDRVGQRAELVRQRHALGDDLALRVAQRRREVHRALDGLGVRGADDADRHLLADRGERLADQLAADRGGAGARRPRHRCHRVRLDHRLSAASRRSVKSGGTTVVAS